MNIIPFFNEILAFLQNVERIKSEHKSKKLHKLYYRIYTLLNELQTHNTSFLMWLQYAYKYDGQMYFSEALKEMVNVSCLKSCILEILDSEFSKETVNEILSFEDKELSYEFRKIIGGKRERIRFWKNLLQSKLESVVECGLNRTNRKKRSKIKIFTVDKQIDDIDFPMVQVSEVIVDSEFLKKQIETTQEVIKEFNEFISAFYKFIKSRVELQDIL